MVVDTPNLYNDWRKTYGTLFDLPFAFIEFFELNIEKIFLLKHFSLFIIYFISTIFFFLLIKKNLNSKKIAIMGVLILISSPRIFSHSFYNSKDILFLSLMIMAAYFCLELLKNYNFKNLFISCLLCAFASNIRIIGIYLPLLTFIFYYFSNKRSDSRLILIFLKFFSLFF